MATQLTSFSKFLITLLIVGGIGGGLYYLANKTQLGKDLAKNNGQTNDPGTSTNSDAIKIGVVTWGGYAGGEYYNNGFKASEESRFFKDCGIKVEFKLIDDFNASREAFKADEVNLLWTTVDAFPTEAGSLKEFSPQIVLQADWSRGGDAIVVQRGINTVADLKGKRVAVAPMTPSHTFLLWMLEASGMKPTDITIVEAPSAIDAAAYFKANKVDAAVVWSPDDEDCIKSVKGSKILKNTKSASNIISDVFIAKKAWIDANEDKLKCLVEGWLKGAAEINSNPQAKTKAAKILAEGLNQPEDFCLNAINNVRLCTYGDNVNFFNIKGDYAGVKGEDIYTKMSDTYGKLGLAKDVPNWRLVSNPKAIRSIANLTGSENQAEGEAKFAPPTAQMKDAEAFASKKITITFASASSTLDENAKHIIDLEFADIAKAFGKSRIRVEGNTDNIGDPNKNLELSRKRAQAVADYLATEYKMDKNRFVIVGNGSNKPIADNNTDEGKSKNRRTDFDLLSE